MVCGRICEQIMLSDHRAARGFDLEASLCFLEFALRFLYKGLAVEIAFIRNI